jgi:multidrug efflux system outer membrane protein
MTRTFAPLLLAAALAAAGCVTLEPELPKAQADIPQTWPLPEKTSSQETVASSQNGSTAVADIGWRDFFVDDDLEAVIARALESNRDLRVAVLNVERARALYRVQRSERLPSVGGSVQMTRTGGDGPNTEAYSASVGVAGFELDLFGRVRSLSEAALRDYFATEEARRAAQLSLVAEVANAWLTLAADRELLKVSQATLKTQEDSYKLTQRRHELGAVSRVDLAQAQTQVEAARSDLAGYEGRIAADINALQLLVGAPIDTARLPAGFATQHVSGIAAVPAGLPSEALLRRPDVRGAEERLRAANANIGAARAALFPSISLTGNVGTASSQLSGLFGSGSFAWSFIPQVSIPIFQAGRLGARLDAATVERDITLAQYERAIQSGFREVADALAASRALANQREAQERLVTAAAQAEELSRARYEAGRDSYLLLLVAQRTLYQAQQQLVVTRLAEQGNRVALYKALGGGWKEAT